MTSLNFSRGLVPVFLIIHTDSPTGDLQTKLPCFFPFVFFLTSPFLCLFPQSFFFSLRNHIVHLIVVWLAQPPQSSHMSQCVYVGSLEMPVTWLQTPMRRLMWRMEATVLNWRLCKSLFPPHSLFYSSALTLTHTGHQWCRGTTLENTAASDTDVSSTHTHTAGREVQKETNAKERQTQDPCFHSVAANHLWE